MLFFVFGQKIFYILLKVFDKKEESCSSPLNELFFLYVFLFLDMAHTAATVTRASA